VNVLASTANDLARVQFATTIIYHFIFPPITIGLAFLVAILQTAWYRTGNLEYKRLCRFFGTLLLINVAIAVVTGLIMEFQFGMNWSLYSRFVGSVFGAPLALEGLAAFFLESTFIGLWVFGWNILPKRIHLATIWLFWIGSLLSAMFILMANSWMQHPVGYRIDSQGNAVLTNVWDLFVNPTFRWGYAHVILASLVTGSLLMLCVSAWHLRKGDHTDLFLRTAKLSLIVLFPAIVIQLSVGNKLGQVEATYQPMKIAAAEGQWNTCSPCSFSVAQIGGFSESDQSATKIIAIPHLLSVLATGTWSGPVQGMNQIQRQYTRKYGRGNYIPNVTIQYLSIRVMAGLGFLVALLALWGGWLLVKGRLLKSRVFLFLATWAMITPVLMNTAGWLLTESGRQPWIVQGLQKTANANSPSVSTTDIAISLSLFVLAFIILGIADFVLMFRYARHGLAQADAEAAEPSEAPDAAPALTY